MNNLTVTMKGTELKSPELAKAASEILASYNKAERVTEEEVKKVCRVLGRVSKTESYKEDGFKSVEEFATAYCGMPRSTAYAFAAYGRMILRPDCPDAVKAMSPFTYDAIKVLGEEFIRDKVNAGEIPASLTQKAAAEYAAAHKEEAAATSGKKVATKKPKVLSRYNVSIPAMKKDLRSVTEADVDEAMAASESEVVKLPKVEGSPDILLRKLYLDKNAGVAYLAVFYKINESTTKSVKANKRNAEMRKRMEAMGMSPEVIAKVLGE